MKKTILNFLNKSKEDIFNNYYIISDNSKIIEEYLMAKTDTLFNLEIQTYQEFLKTFNYQVIPNNHLTLEIYNYLNTHETIFDQANKLELATNLAPILIELDKYQTQEIKVNPKIQEIFKIKNYLEQKIPNIVYNHETNILKNPPSNNNYLFITDYDYPLYFQLISKLKENNNVEIYQSTNLGKIRNLQLNNFPITHDEINQIILEINYLITSNEANYQDIAIYYSDETILNELQQTLEKYKLSYNKHIIQNNPLINSLKYLIKYLKENDLLALIDLINTNKIYGYSNMYLNKYYIEHRKINIENIPFINQINKLKEVSQDYLDNHLSRLISLIDNIWNKTDKIILINLLKDLSYPNIQLNFDCFCDYVLNNLKITHKIENKKEAINLYTFDENLIDLINTKYVFIPNCTQETIPPTIKDHNLILDFERAILKLPTIHQQHEKFINKFNELLRGNYNKIYLTYSLHDNSQQPMEISSHIKQLTKDLSNNPFHEYFHHQNFTNYQLNNQIDPQSFPNKLINKYITSNNQPPNIPNLLDYKKMSASKFEKYNACPFAYYLQYQLKLNPFDNPNLQANETGSLAHYVFENNLNSIDKIIDEEKIKKDLQEYIKKNYSDKINNPQNKFLLDQLVIDLINAIHVLNCQQKSANFKTNQAEYKLKYNYSKYQLTGSIDRFDLDDNYVKIIDYKSSEKNINPGYAKKGFDIQLLIYLDTLLKVTNYQPAALLYFNYRKKVIDLSKENAPITKTTVLEKYRMTGLVFEEAINLLDSLEPGEKSLIYPVELKKDGNLKSKSNTTNLIEYQNLVGAIEILLDDLVDQIKEGNIQISPSIYQDNSHNSCKYCNYKSICRFDVFYNQYRVIKPKEEEKDESPIE